MGNITGAMVFQSTIPTVVALVFASSTWVIAEGSYVAFASAGIAFLSSAFIFIPMVRTGVLHGKGLLVGGVFYLAYLALVDRGHQRRRSGRPRPTDILPRPQRRSPRMLTEKSDAAPTTHHAPTPGSLDDLICYFEGDWVADARRQGQHHDPRVHVRDRDLRGDPGVLERRAEAAVRAEGARARRAPPPVVPDPADDRRAVGRRADAH